MLSSKDPEEFQPDGGGEKERQVYRTAKTKGAALRNIFVALTTHGCYPDDILQSLTRFWRPLGRF